VKRVLYVLSSKKANKGGAMGTITVKVSDLTGEQISDERNAARLIVEHPDFPEPIGLDVLPDEVQPHLTDERRRFVVVSLEDPDNPNPQRYVMSMDEFEDLFQQGDSSSVLQEAFATQQQEAERTTGRTRRRAAGRRQGRQRIDYSSPELAGEPHPGRITEAEKAYVREHLDEVNARLRSQGRREIDPNDPMMAQRYGLGPEPFAGAVEGDEEPEA
jgi:hypothetical protein